MTLKKNQKKKKKIEEKKVKQKHRLWGWLAGWWGLHAPARKN